MPWTETVTMQRLEFILACQSGEETITDICRRYGISRKTGYKWLNRFDPLILASLENRSRARHAQPDKLPPDVAECLLRFREAHPDWGPKKIRHWFLNHDAAFSVPAASTIGDLLAGHGLVPPRLKRKRTPGNRLELTVSERNNQVWCADFKGRFRLKDRSYCRPFTLTDNHSRYVLACEAGGAETTAFVRDCMGRAFRECGLPDVMRTDNGAPFAGPGLVALTQLSVWLIKLGILPERIEPGKPQQNGRHERMHKSLKLAMSHGNIFHTLEEQQAWFSHWREEFNHERPHESLNDKPPASQWEPSLRQWDGREPEVYYAQGARLYRVGEKGEVRLNGRLFLSEALKREYVEFREVDERLDAIHFGKMLLAYYDRAERRIIRID